MRKSQLPPDWLEPLSHARILQLTEGADAAWAHLEAFRRSQPNPEAAQVWVDRIAAALEHPDPEAELGGGA
ncbi:MAG: hypothetical protein CL923_07570 [Deltaproteobacteria bacterium]|nr:hypothetical protein [Deltaproteobacteria bacterium]MDP7158458.1 hypothetical protein [SAR324 cluster bacterium]MBQ32397.1 hypothetical protein [Deltaproteobacteria bacterium]MDP7316952.1 hypothetical protein [SAR324 cluster bacterium]MDP7463196.1 hypothetical protein [SAR324 cluster bacterium]